MADIDIKDPKVLNLLKGTTNEKRLERKIVNLFNKKKKDSKNNKSALGNKLYLEELAKEINKNISDNEMIFQILPDLKLAMSFLISGILSPKDLMYAKLNFLFKEHRVKREMAAGVISVIEEHFTEELNLNSLLPKILEDTLFLTGSYSMLILPETEIDRVINSDCKISTEDYNKSKKYADGSLGFIKDLKKIHNNLEITDNFNIVKLDSLKTSFRAEEIDRILSNQSPSREQYKPFERTYSKVSVTVLEPQSDKLIGDPTIIKVPSESVVPVHIPGNPQKHIGYFILLDKNGYPVNGKKDRKVYEQLQGRLSTETEDNVREILKQTRLAIYGYEENPHARANDFNIDTYIVFMENELKKKLSTGIFENNFEIADLETVSKIMFARAIKEKQSTILFVPEKLLSYIAFKYNDYGIGKSLLEDTRILSSLRAVLLFSNVMASIKNSVPRTGVKINLDEADPNPRETVEFLLNEFSRNHNMSFPVGLTNPADIIDSIQRSSIDVAVSGNTKYPETNIDITDKSRSVSKPDSDLENQLRRRQYMSFGLPPEIIDADMNIDYAVSVIASNSMACKEISIYQDKLSVKLKDFVVKYISVSERLTDSIVRKIGKNKSLKRRTEEFNDLLKALEINLPKPNTTKLENQLSALDTYTSGLEKALEAYINPDVVSRLIDGDLEDAIEPTVECIKTYYIRQWMHQNNVFSELANLVDISDPENKLRMDVIQKDHINSLLETVGKLLVHMRKKGDSVMNMIENQTEEETEENVEESEENETTEEEGGKTPEGEEEGEGEENEESEETIGGEGGEEEGEGGKEGGEEEGEREEE